VPDGRLSPVAPVGRDRVVDIDPGAVIAQLERAGCVAAPQEADELIRASAGDAAVLESLVVRRSSGEPLAWVTGTATFCGLALIVEPGVYVPRPHTEPLARRAASLLPPSGTAVDLCTGAGAIAAVLTAARPAATVVATELDAVAARCARRNGVEVFQGSLDEPLPSSLAHEVDVMTAAVPYVPSGAIRLLPRDVRAFEPRLALDGGARGTDLLVEVAMRSVRWLRPGGLLLLELGGDQAGSLGRLLVDLGFGAPDVMADDDGDPRAICARLADRSTDLPARIPPWA
jgi:release factor glutamine methyltransferase